MAYYMEIYLCYTYSTVRQSDGVTGWNLEESGYQWALPLSLTSFMMTYGSFLARDRKAAYEAANP